MPPQTTVHVTTSGKNKHPLQNYPYSIFTSTKRVMFAAMSVCLLAGLSAGLHKNY